MPRIPLSKLDQAITDDLANYYQLYKLADAMDRMLRDAGVDFCGKGCPLCVARARFAPRKQPRLVDATVETT